MGFNIRSCRTWYRSIPYYNVGRHGSGRPTNLRRQPKLFIFWKRSGELIHRDSKLVRQFERSQFRVIPHQRILQPTVSSLQPFLLPVQHFLVTFTVPDELRSLLRVCPKEGYDAIFAAGSATTRSVAADCVSHMEPAAATPSGFLNKCLELRLGRLSSPQAHSAEPLT